ncbi:MAG: hypothetical protein K5927_08765 [Lachnospiraceae bacterium]|nr:hypothetical protein [Lachnospiraceae bacterium]
MKKSAYLLLTIAIVLSSLFGLYSEADAATTSKYGFSYDTSLYNVQWKTSESIYVRNSSGYLLGTMTYYTGLARRKGTSDYIVMFREVMTPNPSKVYTEAGNKCYGLSEYVSVKSTLKQLGDYKPQNTPATDTMSFSLGLGSDKKASISASYDIKHTDLDITSSCNTPNNLYFVKYDYKPSIANPFASNKYVSNESVQLGEAQFDNTDNTIKFTVYYDARFGGAEDSKRSPWLIYLNYVKQKTGSKTYSFTISK